MPASEFAFQQLPVERRRLRVAVVTETYPPEINGVAMTLGRMVRALQQREHQVQLIRPKQDAADLPRDEQNLEQVLRPGLPIPNYAGLKMGLPAKSALYRLWSLKRPDVVQIATEGPLGWSAMAAARKLRIPVATDFHTNFHSYSRHYGLGWLKKPIVSYLRKFHSQARVTMVPSATIRRDLEAAGFRNVRVVARGVDTALFQPERRSAELRRAWGLGDGDLAVLNVGRMAPEKNLGLLLQAFAAIRQARPEARLVLVGDGPELANLKASHPHVVSSGARRGEDLATHFASADLFLFPSMTETFGNVLLEAMASGLCGVGFDYAAAAEHLRHDHDGLKAVFEDDAGFVAQALRAATRDELRRTLGARARQTAMGLSWDNIFTRLEGILIRVVEDNEAYHEKALFGVEFG